MAKTTEEKKSVYVYELNAGSHTGLDADSKEQSWLATDKPVQFSTVQNLVALGVGPKNQGNKFTLISIDGVESKDGATVPNKV